MVAEYPIVEGRISELTILTLVAVVRFFWLRNNLHTKILWGLSDSNYVLFLHGDGVDDGVTDGILETAWCNRCRVRVNRGSSEFFWSVSSLVCVSGSSIGYIGIC